jgi:hypothetical protein
MFIIKILSFVLCTIIACVIFSILFWLVVFAIKFINGIKKQIVWAFLDKVSHLMLYPAKKCYRRDIVETGFSMGSHYRSAPIYHYRYKTVFDSTYRNVMVQFANKMKIKINIKEESLLYQKLLNM